MVNLTKIEEYKNILVAVDFAGEYHKVVGKAYNFLKQANAELSLIHVVKPVEEYIAFNQYLNLKEIHQEIVEKAEKQMAKIGNEINVPSSRQLIIVGYAKTEILKTAKNISADLIVIGRHATTDIQKLLGSTTDAVLRNDYCDVLTVTCKGGSANNEPI